MPVEKIKPYMKPDTLIENRADNLETKRGYHTTLSVVFSFLAVGVMIYIGIRNVEGAPSSDNWGWLALMQAGFGLVGYVGMTLITGQGIFPSKEKRPSLDDNSPMVIAGQVIPMQWGSNFAIALFFGLLVTIVSQLALEYYYSISVVDQALYFVFASVCEELLFRGFLMELFLFMGEQIWKRFLAIFTSAILFAWVHFQYHGDFVGLLGIFIMGLVFATDYDIRAFSSKYSCN